jgi:heme/copper-type cytochrome/quinol oxidase subunit 2
VIKKKTMEKFVSWQYLMTYFLFVFLMVSIIFSSSYHIITGEEFTHRWDNILTFSIGITVVVFGLFITFIFPRKYPEEFEEYYRKPIRENPEVKKAIGTLKKVILLLLFIMSPWALLFIYDSLQYGLKPEDLDIVGILGIFYVIMGLAIYFMRLLEK